MNTEATQPLYSVPEPGRAGGDLRSPLDSLREAVFTLDGGWEIRGVNAAATRLFGVAAASWHGFPFERLFADAETLEQFRQSHLPALEKDGLAEGESRMRRNDGGIFPAETTLAVLRDSSARLAGRILVVRDISHRKRNEEQILRRARELAVLHELGALINRHLDLDQILTASLGRLAALLRCDVAAFFLPTEASESGTLQLRKAIGLELRSTEPGVGGEPEEGPEAQAAAGRRVILFDDLEGAGSAASRFRHAGVKSAAYIPVEAQGRVLGVLALGRRERLPFAGEDVDLFLPVSQIFATAMQNARLFADLDRHRRMLARLSSRLLSAQEEERLRLSRELHDGIGQSLSALKLGLEMLAATPGPLPPGSRRDLDRALGVVTDVIGELRRIARDLRPAILDDLGLVTTLRWLTSQFQEQTGLPIRLVVRGPESALPPQREVNLYRTVQELLNNVVKHAAASRVEMEIDFLPTSFRLSVADDGQGFDPGDPRSPGEGGTGLGLIGIRERVHLMKGRLTIESAPGTGTRVELEVPATEESPGDAETLGRAAEGSSA